jgi:hypothetical protein
VTVTNRKICAYDGCSEPAADHPRARFCSRDHQRAGNKREVRERSKKTARTGTCKECGIEFLQPSAYGRPRVRCPKHERRCTSCGKEQTTATKSGLCRACEPPAVDPAPAPKPRTRLCPTCKQIYFGLPDEECADHKSHKEAIERLIYEQRPDTRT